MQAGEHIDFGPYGWCVLEVRDGKDPNNGRRAARYGGYGWWWWLRSPGRAGNRAVYIWGDGNIGIQGNGTFRYASTTLHPVSGDNSGGVRPVLWLNL